MKTLIILYSALAVAALAAGVFAAKANVDDQIFIYNTLTNRCDLPAAATLFPHGERIGTTLATLFPDDIFPVGNCVLRDCYPKI